MPNVDIKEVGLILTAGAVGGELSVLFAKLYDQPFKTSVLLAVIASPFLGMGAAYIGVYVIANSDTKAFLRCLGFAMLCGLTPKPIYDIGATLITQRDRQQEIVALAKDANKKAAEGKESLAQLPPKVEDATHKVADVTSKAIEAVKIANVTDNPQVVAEAKATTSEVIKQINDLEREGKITKEIKEESVGKLEAK